MLTTAVAVEESSQIGALELNNIHRQFSSVIVGALDADQQAVRAGKDTFCVHVDVVKIGRGQFGQSCVSTHGFNQATLDCKSLHGNRTGLRLIRPPSGGDVKDPGRGDVLMAGWVGLPCDVMLGWP